MKSTRTQNLSKLLVGVIALGILPGCGKKETGAQPAVIPVSSVNASNTPASAAPTAISSPEFEKLKGQWQRPDGGYIVEIRSVEPGGKLDAAYFNPRSIHVAKAEASQEGEAVRVFIELRDVNYPGSTYTLAYEPASDQLKGIYFQAALRQQFEVLFERLK